MILLGFTAAKTVYVPFYRNMTLKSARYVSTASSAKDGSNYFELKVYANDGTEILAAWTNHNPSGQDFTGGVPVAKSLVNMDEGDFDSTQVCKVESTLHGTGTIGGHLLLEFADARSY
tara:strand:+ start:222 stop:575 length:354 start_codon:yes stop_codon:yes gene_type:complete